MIPILLLLRPNGLKVLAALMPVLELIIPGREPSRSACECRQLPLQRTTDHGPSSKKNRPDHWVRPVRFS